MCVPMSSADLEAKVLLFLALPPSVERHLVSLARICLTISPLCSNSLLVAP